MTSYIQDSLDIFAVDTPPVPETPVYRIDLSKPPIDDAPRGLDALTEVFGGTTRVIETRAVSDAPVSRIDLSKPAPEKVEASEPEENLTDWDALLKDLDDIIRAENAQSAPVVEVYDPAREYQNAVRVWSGLKPMKRRLTLTKPRARAKTISGYRDAEEVAQLPVWDEVKEWEGVHGDVRQAPRGRAIAPGNMYYAGPKKGYALVKAVAPVKGLKDKRPRVTVLYQDGGVSQNLPHSFGARLSEYLDSAYIGNILEMLPESYGASIVQIDSAVQPAAVTIRGRK